MVFHEEQGDDRDFEFDDASQPKHDTLPAPPPEVDDDSPTQPLPGRESWWRYPGIS